MLTKYAALVNFVVDGPGLTKQAHRADFAYEPRPGFLYIRSRAISSRCNDNFDSFPAAEIQKGYRSFIGKPVFVNHVNEDHHRARGVVIDAALHHDVNPDGSPDTWAEVLMEVDAMRFPKLARAIVLGHVDRTSMGVDVEYSICSACGNRATTPAEYCRHIPQMKGSKIIRRNGSTGRPEETLIFEECYGLSFFENSLLVEDPADPTAYFLGVDTRGLKTAKTAAGLKPLPVERGLYYRSHPKEMPFGRAHARTQNIGEAPAGMEHYWEPKEGYSAFWSPHHVQQYHDDMGWDFKGRDILAFRGHPVGEGADGEPRVMPDNDKPVARISPRQFQDRLEITPYHGRYDEHTWGEDSEGQRVDDGYRRLAQKAAVRRSGGLEGFVAQDYQPSYLYHHTDPENRDSISEHGLDTRHGGGGRIYLSGGIPWGTESADIWRADVRGHPMHEDNLGRGSGWAGAMYTEKSIPPERLKLIWPGHDRPNKQSERDLNQVRKSEHDFQTKPMGSEARLAMLRWVMAAFDENEDLTGKSPGEIDQSLSEHHDKLARHEHARRSALDMLHHLSGDRQTNVGRTRKRVWGKSDSEVLGHDTSTLKPWNADQWNRNKARHDEAVQGIADTTAHINRHEGEFSRRGGWSRFFTVPDGHIHSSRQCHSCRPTTKFGWQPELSGKGESEAVDTYGPHLCTHCFPSAPTEWKRDPTETRAEEKQKSGEYCAGGKASKFLSSSEVQDRRAAHPQNKLRVNPGEAFYAGGRQGSQGRCPTCETMQKVKNDGNFYQHKPPEKPVVMTPPREEPKPEPPKEEPQPSSGDFGSHTVPQLPHPAEKKLKSHLNKDHRLPYPSIKSAESRGRTLQQVHDSEHESPNSWVLTGHTHPEAREAHLQAFAGARSWEDPSPFESGLSITAIDAEPLFSAGLMSFVADMTVDEHLWRQPKPEMDYERHSRLHDEGHTDEASALFYAHKDRENAWKASMQRAISIGHVSPEEATQRGYKHSGYEQDYGERDFNADPERYPEGRPLRGWQRMPDNLYHVTTNAPAVLQHGLKTRDELEQQRGRGLGGGTSDTISFTDNPDIAQDVHRGLHEMRRVARGERTIGDMVDEAKSGKDAERPFWHDIKRYYGQYSGLDEEGTPNHLARIMRGVHSTLDDARHGAMNPDRPEGEGWHPAPGAKTWKHGETGETLASEWQRPHTPEERIEHAVEFHKVFANAREHAGGPSDPLFASSDPHGLAQVPASHIQILKAHPRPEHRGYPTGGMKEWRTSSGHGIDIEPHPVEPKVHFAKLAVNSSDEIPPPMGESPIPEGHVRLFHQTGLQQAEGIREHGISMQHARDVSGPRGVWASHGTTFYGHDRDHATVEFHVPYQELHDTAGGQSPHRGQPQEDWEQRPHHTLIIPRTIAPHEISAIHLPWHDRYHYMKNEGMADDVKAGKYDDLKDHPDYRQAIDKIKREGALSGRMPLQHILDHVKPTDMTSYGHTWPDVFKDIEENHVDFAPQHWSKFLDHVQAHGIQTPVVVLHRGEGEPSELFSGHHRIWAAHKLGLTHVPTHETDDPSEAYDLMDRQGAEEGDWRKQASLYLAKKLPQTYFHGTTEDLQPGDIVRPGNEMGLKTHPQLQRWRGEHVWATPQEEGAWGYSGQAEHQRGTHHQYGPSVGDRPRPRVYEVEPMGPVQKRRRLSTEDPEEYTMPAARVVRRIDIPHPDVPSSSQGKWTSEGWQGRLPIDKSWENWKTLEPDAKDLGEHWDLSKRRHPDLWAEYEKPESEEKDEPEEKPESGQGRFFASLRACLRHLAMAEGGLRAFVAALEPDHEVLWHLTDQHHFAPDPEHHPEDAAFAIQDRSNYKGLYVGNPEAWTANGYHRPYVAEIHAPKSLAQDERWHGEKFIPAEHFDKVKVHRVIPYDAYVREQYGSHGPYEEHAGKEFDTGKKITETHTGTWHDHYPFHYDAQGEKTGPYHYTGKDVRDFTPAQHTKHLKRLRNYLHEVKGWGWNEFNDKHEHVGVPDSDYDRNGEAIRRDRKGNPMTRDRYAKLAEVDHSNHLPNPQGGHDWHHGTPHEFERFDEDRDDEGDEWDETPEHNPHHWNTHLGSHWTSLEGTAEKFAKGKYGNYAEGPGNVFTANLGIKNPKHYEHESDMDTEAFNHAWDGHDPENVHAQVCHTCPPETGGDDDFDDPYEHHWLYGRPATYHLDNHTLGDEVDTKIKQHYYEQGGGNGDGWLSDHPDAALNAEEFKNHLREQGHDGITYGNGNPTEGPIGHKCAITFDTDQIHNLRKRRLGETEQHAASLGELLGRPFEHEAAIEPHPDSYRTLYRGLHFGELPSDKVDDFHKDPEKYLKDYGQWHQNVGIHWTDNPDSAYNFATDRDPEGWAHENDEYDEDEPHGHNHGVILEGRVHNRHIIDPESEEGQGYAMSDAILGHEHPEQEVTVRGEGKVHVHQIHAITEHPEEGDRWTTHKVRQHHLAGFVAALGEEKSPEDAFVRLPDGSQRWGRYGAAGLLLHHKGRYMLQHRSGAVQQGGTWSTPGGALKQGEDPFEGAKRELKEETGLELPPGHKVLGQHHDKQQGGWAYHTTVVDMPEPPHGERGNWESKDLRWFTPEEMGRLDLHPGFAASLPHLLQRQRTGAARPYIGKGWWLTPEGRKIGVYDHYETTPGMARSEIRPHMAESGQVRVRSFNNQLNIQTSRPFTDKQRQSLLLDSDKHSRVFVDVLHPDTEESIHSESGGPEDAERMLSRAHRAAIPHTAARERFYHGTRWSFQPGDMLHPGGGRSSWGYGQTEPYVYTTHRRDIAREFAEDGTGPPGDPDARPKVYEVEHTGPHEADPQETAYNPANKSFRSAHPVRIVREVQAQKVRKQADQPYQGGFEFRFTKARPGGMEAQQDPLANYHRLDAFHSHTQEVTGGRAGHAGYLLWHHGTGVIGNIGVNQHFQRQGLATELLSQARDLAANTRGVKAPRHSPQRTDAGEAWARSTGDRLPRRTQGLQAFAEDEEWRGGHQPSDGPPIHDLLEPANEHHDWTAPDDIYKHMHYYADGEDAWDNESHAAIREAHKDRVAPGSPLHQQLVEKYGQDYAQRRHERRQNGDHLVTIYRAAPRGLKHIGTGDWVTPSQSYARQHGVHATDPKKDWPVYKAKVPAKHVRWAGDSLNEFGYFGPPVETRTHYRGGSQAERLAAFVAALSPDEVQEASPEEFHRVFSGSIEGSPFVHHVTNHTPDEIRSEGMKPLTANGGKTGVLVHDHRDGRIEATGLYNQGGGKGAGEDLLKHAVQHHGVNYVEAYGPTLPKIYERAGFHTTEKYPFDDEQAHPDWDYEAHDRPDYHIMRTNDPNQKTSLLDPDTEIDWNDPEQIAALKAEIEAKLEAEGDETWARMTPEQRENDWAFVRHVIGF